MAAMRQPNKPGLLTLTIKDKSALNLAYMPFVRNGGLFVPTNSNYRLGDEVFMLLNLMGEDEKLPVAGRVIWMTPKGAQGKRTAGIDGKTVGSIRRDIGEHAYLEELRKALRCGAYAPSPCRRKLIPKPGKPGQFRALGIPTVTDRVVQSAVKQLLEPILEARFRHVSYGFRPGRGCHGALEHIRMTLRPRRVSKLDGLRHETRPTSG